MSLRHKIALFLTLATLAPLRVPAQTQKDSPRAVVLRYCTLDLNGARLSSAGFEQMQDLSTWEEEPGWDSFTVTERFVVKDSKVSGPFARVTIAYSNRGSVGDSKFVPSSQIEIVQFKLRLKNHEWRIVSPVIQPHVSPAAAINHIEGLARDEGEESSQNWADALAALKSVEKSANK